MTRRKAVARMLEAIHAQESREACGRKAGEVADELESMRFGAAARTVPDQDEQRDRAHQPRDQEEGEGRRDLPGRQLGPHAGDGEAKVHSGARVGQEEVPGHVEAGGDGRAEGKGGGLEEDGAEDGQINLRKNLDSTALPTTPPRRPWHSRAHVARVRGGRPGQNSPATLESVAGHEKPT